MRSKTEGGPRPDSQRGAHPSGGGTPRFPWSSTASTLLARVGAPPWAGEMVRAVRGHGT